MTRDELKEKIIAAMHKVAGQQDAKLVSNLGEETVLLNSGLDSLGFAVLVATLEMDFGFDPFADADSAYYPRTLAEFIDYYLNNWPS